MEDLKRVSQIASVLTELQYGEVKIFDPEPARPPVAHRPPAYTGRKARDIVEHATDPGAHWVPGLKRKEAIIEAWTAKLYNPNDTAYDEVMEEAAQIAAMMAYLRGELDGCKSNLSPLMVRTYGPRTGMTTEQANADADTMRAILDKLAAKRGRISDRIERHEARFVELMGVEG